MTAGVQLAEQLSGRVPLDGDPQRGGAGRAREPERLDLGDGQAELVLQPGRIAAPGAGDVQVGGAAAAVADREDLVGGEQAEQGERDGDPDGRTDQDVGRGLGTKRDASQPGQCHHPSCRQLAPLPPACTWDQGVQDHHQVAAKCITGDGRAQPPQLVPMTTLERPRPMRTRPQHILGDRGQQLRDDHREDQVPEPSQGQQRQHQPESQEIDDPPGAERGQRLPGPLEPGRVQSGQPP